MQKMRRPGWPQDGEYILNMDALSDEIIRPVPESEATALVKRMATAKSRRALCWALARNRMEYQFVRSCLFTICGVLPAGFLLASTWDVLPKWVTAIFAVIGGGWLIYCAIWSTYAARLMVFEHKTFHEAGYPAQLDTNTTIITYAAFIPILGRFILRKKNHK